MLQLAPHVTDFLFLFFFYVTDFKKPPKGPLFYLMESCVDLGED